MRIKVQQLSEGGGEGEGEGEDEGEGTAAGGGTDRNLPGSISLKEAETKRLRAEVAGTWYEIGSVRLQFLRQLFWLPMAVHWSTTVRLSVFLLL